MLSWLFKKRGPAAAPAAPPAPARDGKAATAGKAAASARAATAPAPAPAPAPAVDEGPLLHAARGDDAALLQLAQTAQTLATKLAAVEALAGEAALRQAERAFRSHDRKVHRLAKQRLEAAVTQREAQAQAQALLDRTRGLVAETLVPVNHVVDIDRAWAALPAQALPPELQQAWTALRAELDAAMRAQEAAQRRLQRWTAEARQRLDAVPRELATAAEQRSAQAAAALCAALTALRAARPDVPATAALDDALARAQQAATALQTQWEQQAEAAAATAADTPAVAAGAAPTEESGAIPMPRAKPAPTPQDEARLAAQRQRLEGLVQQAEEALAQGQLAVLQQRLQAIEHTLTQAHTAPPEALRSRLQALQAERGRLKAWQQWGGARARDDLVAEAETLARLTLAAAPTAAPAAPETSDPVQATQEIQTAEPAAAAAAATAPEPPAQAAPIERAPPGEPDTPTETTARGEVAAPAAPSVAPSVAPPLGPPLAALPATTLAHSFAESPSQSPAQSLAQSPAPEPSPAPRRTKAQRPLPPVKLNLKEHADRIQSLRRRWKALDHQGAVASAESWRRFDGALQLAHEPVAAQQAVLKAARLENLAAREALLAALEAAPAPVLSQAPAAMGEDMAPADEDHAGGADRPPPDWRACIAELDRFQTAWRRLGPAEHTVPAAARDTLQQRLNAALARIEGPLQQARATAAAAREQLIAEAERLLPSATAGRPAPEASRQVRELQAAWQEHARRLPLPRGLETSLWTRFKTATDAVFVQREAAFAARDAELASHLAAANALVERLTALDIATPPADIQRTLAEVDRAWRQGGELPRGAIEALEGRFHAARGAAAALLNAGQQQRWQARCDTLAARLALCEAREDGAAAADVDALAALNARWAEADAVPAPWQQALAQRWAQPPGAGPLVSAEVDGLLLRLEAALNLPTAPAWQAARQQLKLRALKDTLEGRAPAQAGPQQHAEGLQALLRQAGLDAAQRARLRALLAALRAAQPGVLGLPPDKA